MTITKEASATRITIRSKRACGAHGTGTWIFPPAIHVQQVDRPGFQHFRSGRSIQLRRTRALSALDLKHSFVATYQYQLPLAALPARAQIPYARLGTSRESRGSARVFRSRFHSDGDNSLQGSLPNGVNNHSLDLPDFIGGPLNLNHDPRNGLPYFNHGVVPENALGTPGTASRRSFYGPGMLNFDHRAAEDLQASGIETAPVPTRDVQYVQSRSVLWACGSGWRPG